MRDARDAEDALLLEQGDYDLLVAAYAEVVVQRCLIAAGDDGRDVAQDVFARLLGELRRGKRYTEFVALNQSGVGRAAGRDQTISEWRHPGQGRARLPGRRCEQEAEPDRADIRRGG